jgi:hypothetical protein
VDYPPFADAVTLFRSFLDENGHRVPIRWFFPEDVLLIDRECLIRQRLQAEVLEELATAYQSAVDRRLGVKFDAYCDAGEAVWCYIYYPADRHEAEQCMMPDGLKLSIRLPLAQGRIVAEREWTRLLGRGAVRADREWFT